MQKLRILAEYEGKEFELIIGQEYEFSGDLEKENWHNGILYDVIAQEHHYFYRKSVGWYTYIRPVQKPITR